MSDFKFFLVSAIIGGAIVASLTFAWSAAFSGNDAMAKCEANGFSKGQCIYSIR